MAKVLAAHAPRHLAVEDRVAAKNARSGGSDRAAGPAFNGMAIAGLVMGVTGVPLFFSYEVAPVLAILFGVAGLGQIRDSRGRERGRWMAVAAVVLGLAGVGLGVAAVVTGHAGLPALGHLFG
ncbi:MAG TPA: DUF4190 domain-containing protein [Actinomycetota bacterium]|nr:DUF4190 domain-containing protein [Actinomycetota bacterium]